MAEITVTSGFEAYPDGDRAVFEAGEAVPVGKSVKRAGRMVTMLTKELAALYIEKGLAVWDGKVMDENTSGEEVTE